MILRLTIFGLLLVLIAVITLSTREGFTDPAVTVTVSKICKNKDYVCVSGDADCKSDSVYLSLYGKTSASTAQNVRIVYSSTSAEITGTASSDTTLTETAVAAPAPSSSTLPDALITNVRLDRLTEGKTYYIISKVNTTYTAGSTTVPLLGKFTYRAADVLDCPRATPSTTDATAVISFQCKDGNNVRIYGHTTKTTAVKAKIVYHSTTNEVPVAGTTDRTLSSSLTFQPRTSLTPSLVAIVPLADLANGKTYYIISNTDTAYTNGTTTLLGFFTHKSSGISDCPAPDRSTSPYRRKEKKSDVSVSDAAYTSMTLKQRADLLQEVKKAMREEIMAARRMNPSADRDGDDDDGACNSSADQQGREFSRRRPKCDSDDGDDAETRCPTYPNGTCPPVPDMSKYIRKDAIPCWGCSVDF